MCAMVLRCAVLALGFHRTCECCERRMDPVCEVVEVDVCWTERLLIVSCLP